MRPRVTVHAVSSRFSTIVMIYPVSRARASGQDVGLESRTVQSEKLEFLLSEELGAGASTTLRILGTSKGLDA